MGADLFPEYVEIKRADILAQSDYMRKEKLDNLKFLQQYYEQIIEEQQCLSLKDLAVKGKDLMELGMKPGKDLGVMLSYLLEQVLEEPQRNKKDMLLQLAKEKMME
jgi:tRNA nucleotidyltransferase (CCA-adding enzyme)